MVPSSHADCAPWASGTSLRHQPRLGRMALPNGRSDRSGASVLTISSSWARRICSESCDPMLAITTTLEHIGHWTKMRQSLARFSGPESSPQTRSLADFIATTSGFRFSVHTPAQPGFRRRTDGTYTWIPFPKAFILSNPRMAVTFTVLPATGQWNREPLGLTAPHLQKPDTPAGFLDSANDHLARSDNQEVARAHVRASLVRKPKWFRQRQSEASRDSLPLGTSACQRS